jgi:hypothetical protein
MRVPQWLKPAFWGAVVGAVGMMILGFSWGGWYLGSTAERLAKERADAAVTAALTPICVASFLGQPDATSKLSELQKASTWQRSGFIEKGGWATMVGSKTPNTEVARACAAELTKTKT